MTPRVYLFMFKYVRSIVYGYAGILYRTHGSVSGIISQKLLIFLRQSLLLCLLRKASQPENLWDLLDPTSPALLHWVFKHMPQGLSSYWDPSSWAWGSHIFISLLFSTEITTANQNDIHSNTMFRMPLKCGHILRCLQNKWLNQEYYQRTSHNTKNLCKQRKLCLEWCSEQAVQ